MKKFLLVNLCFIVSGTSITADAQSINGQKCSVIVPGQALMLMAHDQCETTNIDAALLLLDAIDNKCSSMMSNEYHRNLQIQGQAAFIDMLDKNGLPNTCDKLDNLAQTIISQ